MTIEDAKNSVGAAVTYVSHPGAKPERGVIVEVRAGCVFVRYGADQHSKATRPEDLALEPLSEGDKQRCPLCAASLAPREMGHIMCRNCAEEDMARRLGPGCLDLPADWYEPIPDRASEEDK